MKRPAMAQALIVLLITLGIFSFFAPSLYSYRYDTAKLVREKWGTLADQVASQVGVDRVYLSAMIVQESGGDPEAPGKAGERGLLQVRPGALDTVNSYYGMGIFYSRLTDPYTGILAGALYLKIQLNEFGNYYLATAAYNAGPGNVRAGGPYADSVEKIKNTLRIII